MGCCWFALQSFQPVFLWKSTGWSSLPAVFTHVACLALIWCSVAPRTTELWTGAEDVQLGACLPPSPLLLPCACFVQSVIKCLSQCHIKWSLCAETNRSAYSPPPPAVALHCNNTVHLSSAPTSSKVLCPSQISVKMWTWQAVIFGFLGEPESHFAHSIFLKLGINQEQPSILLDYHGSQLGSVLWLNG